MQPLPNIAFVITKLTLLPGISEDLIKHQFAVNRPIEYVFTSDVQSSFFGNNITIQTIVGENGAGKSTLIDVMIRMCNNLGTLLYRPTQHLRYEPLRYVSEINAELEYRLMGESGVLRCIDKLVMLEHGDKKYALGIDERQKPDGYTWCDGSNDRQVVEIASHFFYTIVTNYSMQAYISDDYKDDRCITYNHKAKKWVEDCEGIWIDSLFHKNDGYMCPVNLNPFRDSGIIDMTNEVELTRNRIAALLVYFEKQKLTKGGKSTIGQQHDFELIDGYLLHYIEYEPNRAKVLRWFRSLTSDETESDKSSRIISEFKKACHSKNSPSRLILENFCLQVDDDTDDELLWYARLYLVVKVLTIASKYPAYSRYRSIGKAGLALDETLGAHTKQQFKDLAHDVKNDNSHISVKISQVRRFLQKYNNLDEAGLLSNKFTFDQYERAVRYENDRDSLVEIQRRMPPPIFRPKIWLKKSGDDGNVADGSIPFTQLSSGERQFLFTTSAVIYHIVNLKSVDDEQPKYRGVNVVFDEAELCFHPEYQRTFINKFLRIVKSVDIPSDCSLNIIITTHSPFLLSDMPQEHVLYLKNGLPYQPAGDHGEFNPFAANVCDILRNSFFLYNGFMGAYAQKKIMALIDFLTLDNGERDSYDMSLADNLIDMIGDPLLKSHLERMRKQFLEKYPQATGHKAISERLSELEAEVAALKKKMSDEKDID